MAKKSWSLCMRSKLIQTVPYVQNFHDYKGTVKV